MSILASEEEQDAQLAQWMAGKKAESEAAQAQAAREQEAREAGRAKAAGPEGERLPPDRAQCPGRRGDEEAFKCFVRSDRETRAVGNMDMRTFACKVFEAGSRNPPSEFLVGNGARHTTSGEPECGGHFGHVKELVRSPVEGGKDRVFLPGDIELLPQNTVHRGLEQAAEQRDGFVGPNIRRQGGVLHGGKLVS
ncbi:hypothetical protein CTU88_11315 [Streptomyces sp. JV178]|uniref:hypothetical protein n=1 Tax=Streptomyces sp. JV178 TaxID=858632 RepID=UPI000C1B3E2C|nr:hypothetical protein [Streptomyces sp. JV178]PIM72696.1 hypothetical protein CTU88_11315 [Streptomyces sp. JV178]